MLLAWLFVAVTDFGSNPGALDMYEHVPAGLPAGRPIVVVMHGCTQDAAKVQAAGWNTLADREQFTVVYPQQRTANHQLACFNWYTPGDTTRDAGEALSVMQMVDYAIAQHGGDRDRVYITGLSAGAAFTAVMLAIYPERFRAGSIMAGVPYGCGTDLTTATMCTAGTQKTPEQWGALVPPYAGERARVQIWHGTNDFTVNTANATELVEQWTNVWGTDAIADETETISTATRTRYAAGSAVAVELYMVNGMGHAIAIGEDPLGACPSTPAMYFADVKLCSTLRTAEFFGLVAGMGNNGDSTGEPDEGCDCNAGGGPGPFVLLALWLCRRRRSR